MTVFEAASSVLEALEAESIDYMVVGALSTGVYGVPRSTKDVDIVIALETRKPLEKVEERLKNVATFDPQISFETITASLRHILTTVSRPPVIIELFELGKDPYVLKRFSRRVRRFSGQLKREV
ncbi:MAG TPA: hypothetical protein VHM91_15980, partial [Verrucomicrobiales bacterium]|nr:hypothetical protein [Verrucomicrobiales bacterium]